MDQAEFDRLLNRMQSSPMKGGQSNQAPTPKPAQAGPQAQPQADAETAPVLDVEALGSMAEQAGINLPAPGETRPDGTSYDQPPLPEPGLGDASGLDAIAGGAIKSVFETKDFLFGDTPEEDRSEFRAGVEDTVKRRQQESIIDGFSAEISQFATAMIGLGKLQKVSQGVKVVGAALQSAEASRKGAVALEVGKAAMAGAVAFDPHEERLSNVVQDTALANPINAWLAADPTDSAAEGRLKAAMESIGMDAVLMGVFMGSTRIWKHLRKGENEQAAAEATRLETEARSAIEAEQLEQAIPQGPAAGGEVPDAGTVREPGAIDRQLDGLPEGTATKAPADSVESLPAAEGQSLTPSPDAIPAAPVARAADDIEVEVVSSPTEAMQAADVQTLSPSSKPAIRFDDEDTAAVLTGMEADAKALADNGGWYQAIEAGHTFGKGEGIPYRKLNNEADMDDFMARVVDAAEERLDALKGGDVMSDARVDAMVRQRAKLFDDDPALLMGMIAKAGNEAASVVANMEAGYLVANRMFQDAHALAARISLGDFTGAGSKDVAIGELKQRLSLAASVYGASKSMSSNAGRSLRRMRGQFAVDPKAVEALTAMNGDTLAKLIVSTKGDPRNMAKLTNSTVLSKVVDFASFIYVNNLVSGPMTQFINIASNGYMLGVRPLELMIGAVAFDGAKGPASRAILREAVTQYTYMGAAFSEGWRNAVKAFVENDSILAPHRSEVYAGNDAGTRSGAMIPFRKWDSIPNVLFNSMAAMPAQAIGLPTRVLGTVDELVKQVTYRSKVMAGAYWEAVNEAHVSGIVGKELDAFVRQHVADRAHAAFDSEGRGVNAAALREANITTFQQDLLPGTWGKTTQGVVATHPTMRFVLPFVKTPTNVIRYGWKMTPGLNMLQTEYRQMLKGELGEEAKRQAVGQMTLGSLFIGTAAMAVAQGRLTGNGPQDPKAREAWQAAGGVPYSVWWENEDGSVTSVPFNRLDPVAIPFGIIADLQDVINAQPEGADESQLEAVLGALKLAVASQVKSKTFLMGLNQAIEAVMEPERSGYGGNVAANFVPFASALRQLNSDPYLREARDMTDKLMATIPGLSESLPARYDPFGDPILTRKGLWSTKEDNAVDEEIMRLALEGGSTISRPNPTHDGVDLRDLTLSDGRNAYAVYQFYSGHLPGTKDSLKRQVRKVMASKVYQQSPDGDMSVKGTKLWFLYKPVSKYRAAALKLLKRDPVVRDAFLAEQRRVLGHHRSQKSGNGQQRPAGGNLGAVGDAYGIDLKALTGPVDGSPRRTP